GNVVARGVVLERVFIGDRAGVRVKARDRQRAFAHVERLAGAGDSHAIDFDAVDAIGRDEGDRAGNGFAVGRLVRTFRF
ncbi:hypothetical protein DF186_23955, partial [Enterococcus hirae]